MISVRKEETDVLVVELSEHLWAEDLELVVPAVHDAARSPQNPLLLLVEVGTDFDTPPLAVLRQILQPGILAQNRPSRVAVLTTFTQESKATTASQNNLEVQIRFFSPNQRCEAKGLAFGVRHASFITSNSRLIRFGAMISASLFFGLFTRELTGHAFIRRAA